MVKITCVDPHNSDSTFQYCPSFPAAVTFTGIFGLLLIAHVIEAFQYRKVFAWVICMAAAWETAGFALRTLNVIHQTSLGFSMPSTILILLSPLLINAFDYMVFGRVVYFYTPEKTIAGIRAQRLATIFVWLDIATFLAQVAGASMASGNDPESMMRGIHIYMGGIGVQELFILIFTFLVLKFHRRMLELEAAESSTKPLADIVLRPPSPESPLSPPLPSSTRASILANPALHQHEMHLFVNKNNTNNNPASNRNSGIPTFVVRQGWRRLVITLYVTLALITIRVIYRLVEFSQGVWSFLPQHEAFFYCLEALPMSLAIASWNYSHPGKILRGEGSEFPSTRRTKKMTRAEKKERDATIKAATKREKEERKVGRATKNIRSSDSSVAAPVAV